MLIRLAFGQAQLGREICMSSIQTGSLKLRHLTEFEDVGSNGGDTAGGGCIWPGKPGEGGRQLLRTQGDGQGPNRADGPAGKRSRLMLTNLS